MKKIWIAALVLLLGANAAMAETVIKAGYDFKGDFDTENGKYDVDSGYSIAAEQYFSLHEIFDVGFGGEFQFPREMTTGPINGKFSFIPVYAVAKFSPIAVPLMRPYIAGRIGYDFLLGNDAFKNGYDLKGGLHYGAGVGARVLDLFILEGMYTVNKGKISGSPYGDVKYEKWSLYAGFGF